MVIAELMVVFLPSDVCGCRGSGGRSDGRSGDGCRGFDGGSRWWTVMDVVMVVLVMAVGINT